MVGINNMKIMDKPINIIFKVISCNNCPYLYREGYDNEFLFCHHPKIYGIVDKYTENLSCFDETSYYDGENYGFHDDCPLIKQWPKSRSITISKTRTITLLHPILQWLLERFPLLERMLNIIF